MSNPNRFYTYAYLREDKSPYYIGKGSGRRAYQKHTGFNPPSKNRILLLKENLTEEEAFTHEKYMIAVFGRKDLRTGILHNKTDGGEGPSGVIVSDEFKEKIGNIHRGRKRSENTKKRMSESARGKIKEDSHKKNISDAIKNHWKIRKGMI